MKRILSLLINICLLLSSFISVYAEEPVPNIALSCTETDKQIIVKATLNNGSDYCGFSFGITYDNTKLQPVSATVEPSFTSSIKPNLNKTPNQVYFSYTGAETVSENGDVVSFVFDVSDSATGTINFTLVNLKMYDETYSAVTVNGTDISVELPELPVPALILSTDEEVYSGDEFVVSATLANAADYCGISFGIIYDNTKLTPVSAVAGADFISTVRPNLNKAENQVYFSYAGAETVSNNGKVVEFTFKVKNDACGDAVFSVTNFKMYDENYTSIKNECEGTKTTITYIRERVVTNSKVEAGEVVVTLSNAQPGDCVIVALYKGEKLMFTDTRTYNGEGTINIPFNADYDKIKVMVWEDFKTFKPLSVAEEL